MLTLLCSVLASFSDRFFSKCQPSPDDMGLTGDLIPFLIPRFKFSLSPFPFSLARGVLLEPLH